MRKTLLELVAGSLALVAIPVAAAQPAAAASAPQLILRGGILIDGTGAPARGPVDIVIEGDRIARVVGVGAPGMAIDPGTRPELAAGGRELDVAGMYVLPGLVDLFGFPGELPVEYVGKLWLGHGVTTIRDIGCRHGGVDCRELARQVKRGELAYPRVVPFFTLVPGLDAPGLTPEEGRTWVADAERQGAAGIRLRAGPVELLAAAAEEARERGLGISIHHFPEVIARADVVDTTAWGVGIVEHSYGVAEALLPAGEVQTFPPAYNHADEGQRYAQVPRIWERTAAPGSAQWERVIELLVERDVTLVPTLALYEANRDLARAESAPWHRLYTLPELWRSFTPSRGRHAAHWFYWTTADEIAWRQGYRAWMEFLDAFHARGGRVGAGSDAGFMYTVHGFASIRELELLQEAGLDPLEVVRAATADAARALGRRDDLGSVEPGKLADLVVVAENPLENFKVLYATGALKLDRDDRPQRVGGIAYTIRGGTVYDARRLLAEVRAMVAAAWEKDGGAPTPPGMAAGADR